MKQKNSRFYLHTAIGLAFMLLFPLLPPVDPITPVGMSVLGIFIGMLWLWLFVDGMWPSLVALLLIAYSGYMGETTGYAAVTSVFTSAFGNATIIMVTLFMIVFAGIGESGLAERIAKFLLGRKALEGRPYLLIFTVILSSFILTGLGDFIVCLFIMWPIVTEICKKAHYESGSKLWYIMVSGVFFGSVIGQPLLPFKGMVASMLAMLEKLIPGTTIDMGRYFSFSVIMAFILFVAYCVMLKFIIRPDVSGLLNLKKDDLVSESTEKMTILQKVYMGMLAVILFSVLLPNVIPSFKFLSTLGIIGVITVLMTIAMLLKDKEGKAVVDIRKYAKSFNWTIVFQMAAAVYLATALTADATGIKPALTGLLRPAFSGVSATAFALLVIVLTIIVTNVINNLVIGVIMLTLTGSFVSVIPGINSPAIAVMIILSVCIAFLLPSASVYASLLHARRDLISGQEIVKAFIPIIILTMIVYCAIGYPLAAAMF